MLKAGVTTALTALLAPIQADFQADTKWQEIEKKAYPPPEVKKKEKKVKDRGTRFPGAKGEENNKSTASGDVTAQPDGHVEGPDKQSVDVAGSAEAAMKNLNLK